MPSRVANITKRTVDALEQGAIIWDRTLSGFGVRRQRRDRIFIVKTRVGARQRWFSIGKHGTWTVDAARREARSILGEIDRGHDPATKRDVDARTPIMDRVVERFLKEEIEPKRSAATATLYRDLWERLASSKLGKHKMGKSCLSVRRLADVDLRVLEQLVAHSVSETRNRYA